LIKVSGSPMAIQAVRDLPRAKYYAFVLRNDMCGYKELARQLADTFTGAVVEAVPAVTAGEACTALIGLESLAHAFHEVPGPITFSACDNGALYNHHDLTVMLEDDDVDIIVWGVRGHTSAARRPQSMGWVDAEGGAIRRISVKAPLKSPESDPAVVGTFTFRRAEDFCRVVARMKKRDGRINGEFYIDTCINDAIELGLRCRLFEVDYFLSWGAPDDLRTFEYWQSCFHKWESHPYRLQEDSRVYMRSIPDLENRYRAVVPNIRDFIQSG
jgi:hypothetical protein